MVVVAPIVFFYIRPNYERFQKKSPGRNLFLLIFTGVWAINRKTERSWRLALAVVASLNLICGLAVLYIVIFMY
jgi:hypothetical protein